MWPLLLIAWADPPAGTWNFSGDPAEVAKVEAVRDRILDDYNFAIRPIVRSHLARPLAIHDTFRFEPQPDGVRITMTGKAAQSYTVPLDGPRLEGPEGSVKYTTAGDSYVIELVGTDQGTIVHRIDPRGDRMIVHTTISSPRLEGEHSWSLTYLAGETKKPAGDSSGL